MKYFIIVIAMMLSGCQAVVINSDNTKEIDAELTKSTVTKKEIKDVEKSK